MTQSALPAVSGLVASNRNFLPPPEGGGVPPPVVPPPLMVKSSKSIRLLPPLTLRIWKRTFPVKLTVKEAFCSVVELVVTVEPTCVKLLPPLVLAHSCQVLLPSEPNPAWETLTDVAPATSNSI